MCRTHRTWTMDLCRRHAGEILWPSRYLITLNIKCYMDSYTQFQPYPMNLPEYLFHLIFWYVSIHTLTQQTYADHPRSGVHNPHPSIEDHSVAWHDVYSGIEFLYNYKKTNLSRNIGPILRRMMFQYCHERYSHVIDICIWLHWIIAILWWQQQHP